MTALRLQLLVLPFVTAVAVTACSSNVVAPSPGLVNYQSDRSAQAARPFSRASGNPNVDWKTYWVTLRNETGSPLFLRVVPWSLCLLVEEQFVPRELAARDRVRYPIKINEGPYCANIGYLLENTFFLRESGASQSRAAVGEWSKPADKGWRFIQTLNRGLLLAQPDPNDPFDLAIKKS